MADRSTKSPAADEGTILTATMDRRSLLRRAGGLGVGVALSPLLLAACGGSSSSGTTSSNGGGAAQVSLQLNYLENVQFAGSLVALSKGFYRQGGLSVNVLPGGPNLAPEPVVASGKALVGITHTAEAVEAILNGAPLTIIGAAFQKSPTCLVSKKSSPITSPKEMVGKSIGVSNTNLPIWNAFLKVNHIDPSSVKTNTVEFSTQPLADGQIDGLIGFYTNEPIILDQQGVPTTAFLLADFGYPIVDDVYIARSEDLADATKRKQIVALMTAEAKGWQAALADPAMAANLATNVYGKTLHLDMQQQLLSVQAEKTLVTSADTDKNGLFWMSPSTVAATVKSLILGGDKAKASMFTNEVLTTAYKGGIIA